MDTDKTVADIEVTVNKQPLSKSGLGADLIDVTVDDSLDGASQFTLHLHSWDEALQRVSWADREPLGIGAEVAIEMGYVNARKLLIVGELVSLELSMGTGHIPTLTATGFDYRHRLSLGRVIHTFPAGLLDSQMALQVIQRNNLEADVTPTQELRGIELQPNETDYAFLTRLAERNGYEVVLNGRTVCFRPRQAGTAAPLPLSIDHDLLDFGARLSVAQLFKTIFVVGKDNRQQKFRGSATWESLPGYLTNVDRLSPKDDTYDQMVVKTKDDANQRAKEKLDRMKDSVVNGHGKCFGNPDVRAGVLVQINGAGQRFSGTYRVSQATHSFSIQGGYMTNFSLSGRIS